MTACHLIHLIDKVSVSPHGLFLYPARHSKKRKGKINIYAEVKMACNEQASRAVFAYPGLGQKFWIASVVSVYLKKKKRTPHTHTQNFYRKASLSSQQNFSLLRTRSSQLGLWACTPQLSCTQRRDLWRERRSEWRLNEEPQDFDSTIIFINIQ